MKEQKLFMDYLAELSAWLLGGAMFIYLGYRTLDFLTFTLREDDALFAYLGLFSTTGGAIIFALIRSRAFYFDRVTRKWRSDEFKKTISTVMMVVCFLGELLLAIADMSLVTSEKGGTFALTDGELKVLIWLTAGLAAAVGGAIASIKLTRPNPKTDPEIDMSDVDTNNNGVLDSREKNKPQQPQNQPHPQNQPQNQPMKTYNSDTEKIAALEKELAALRNPTPAGGNNHKQPPAN